MSFFNFNQRVILFILIGFILTGCQNETFESAETTTELNLQAKAGHILPDQQCGPSRNGVFSDNNGVPMANVEILNSETNIHLLLTMNQGYFLESVFANFGTTADIPVHNNTMVLEDFMFQDFIPDGATNYTVVFPTSALPICNDIVLMANFSHRNIFGQTISTQSSWLGNNSIYNGQFYKYCLNACN